MNGKVPFINYNLMIVLPEDVDYIPGSSYVYGEKIDDPQVNDEILTYRLGNVGAEWEKTIRLRARLKSKADGKLVTKALFIADTKTRRGIRSSVISC